MADSPEVILSVQDAVQEFSWQTRANGGRAENVETDTIRERLHQKRMLNAAKSGQVYWSEVD
jgi:hypothetical protein